MIPYLWPLANVILYNARNYKNVYPISYGLAGGQLGVVPLFLYLHSICSQVLLGVPNPILHLTNTWNFHPAFVTGRWELQDVWWQQSLPLAVVKGKGKTCTPCFSASLSLSLAPAAGIKDWQRNPVLTKRNSRCLWREADHLQLLARVQTFFSMQSRVCLTCVQQTHIPWQLCSMHGLSLKLERHAVQRKWLRNLVLFSSSPSMTILSFGDHWQETRVQGTGISSFPNKLIWRQCDH